jgi:CBS domain-containing membrane protein
MMNLQNFENIDLEDFSRALPLVRDLMTKDVFCISVDAGFDEVRKAMEMNGIRHLPVIDKERKLVGLITHRDYLMFTISALAPLSPKEREDFEQSLKVKKFMQTNVMTVPAHTTLVSTARIMYDNKYGCLPVLEKGCLAGIITESDFLKFFLKFDVFKS